MDLTLFQNKVARLQEVVLNGFEDPNYVDNYEGVFRSHFDWHSSVHAHWMLLSSSRIFKTPEITTRILNRLNAQNLDSERKFLTDHPNFELPYGQAWLLLLFSEMNKHLAPNQQLKEFQHETYLRVADWLTKTEFPEKSKNAYHSWLITYFLLIKSDLFVSEPLIKPLKEKFHSVSMVKDENDPKDFFSSESLFAILNNQSKPMASANFLQNFGEISISNCHSVGRYISQSWTNQSINKSAIRDTLEFLDFIMQETRFWKDDFKTVSHWVPQFLWFGIWLNAD